MQPIARVAGGQLVWEGARCDPGGCHPVPTSSEHRGDFTVTEKRKRQLECEAGI